MINLLPPDVKEDIIYARRNTRLRSWALALLVSILGVGGIVGSGYLYMESTIRSYADRVEKGQQQLEVQELTKTQNEVKDLTNSLKLVVQVLSRQILFSEMLGQIGAALPNGSVLTGLSISSTNLGTTASQSGIDLQAAAVDYQTATQVQINLQDPDNKIFEKADIVNVQCSETATAGQPSDYPCSVQVRALFAKDNPFLFISKGTAR